MGEQAGDDQEKGPQYFDYDGRPAMMTDPEDWNTITVMMPGGKIRPVTEIATFNNEATEMTKEAYDHLVARMLKASGSKS